MDPAESVKRRVKSDIYLDEEPEIPMGNSGVAASLPAAEEVKTTVNPPGRGYAKRFWIVVVASVVCTAAIITGIAVGVSNKKKSNKGPATVSEVTRGTDRLDEVVEYLVEQGVSDREDLTRSGSAQHFAAKWIANLDELNLPVPVEDADDYEGYRYVSRYILSLLWYALGGSEWEDQFGDLSKVDICQWNTIAEAEDGTQVLQGHFCDQNLLPAALFLNDNNMKGVLPREITLLDTVHFIQLEFNEIEGTFYEDFCDMDNILFLSLAHNDFDGFLPDCISDMTQLAGLTLSDNEFSGEIPDLSTLAQLQMLMLDDNDLSGDVTDMFNEMGNLKTLLLDDNGFTGFIDEDFLWGLENLTHVDISENDFDGEFPAHLLDYPNLMLLDVHDNGLEGWLPDDIAENTVLQLLSFHRNDFEGTLPESLSNLKALWHLDASENSLTGDIPASIGTMTALEYLFLSENDFDIGIIPDTFASLTNLEELSLKDTGRNGTIPAFIADMKNLILLDLDDNWLEGEIPASLGGLENLEFLLLNSNDLTGTVPQSFSGLTSLRAVFLDDTDLSGDLDVICALPTFSSPDRDEDGADVIVADCGGDDPDIQCQEGCCDVCCSFEDDDCNESNEAVASLEPEWEYGFRRAWYDFGSEEAKFYNPNYIGYDL